MCDDDEDLILFPLSLSITAQSVMMMKLFLLVLPVRVEPVKDNHILLQDKLCLERGITS